MSYWGQDDPELRNKLRYKILLKNRIKSWLVKEGKYEFLSNFNHRQVRYITIYNNSKIGFTPNLSMQELEWIVKNKDSFIENLKICS